MGSTLAYLAAAITALWGVAHIVPTPSVLRSFEPITQDNRRVLFQEWAAEAFTMWGIAAFLVAVTVTGTGSSTAHVVYGVAAGLLVGLAVLTSLTGARTPVIWFKVCPVLLSVSAALLIAAIAI